MGWTSRLPSLLVRLALLGLLFHLLHVQYLEFIAEDVSTALTREPAPFPQLTLCPAKPRPQYFQQYDLQHLARGDINITEFYRRTTWMFFQRNVNFMQLGENYAIWSPPQPSELGTWKKRYYLVRPTDTTRFDPILCFTFFPLSELMRESEAELPLQIMLAVNELFSAHHSPASRDVGVGGRKAFHLYVHGDEGPSIGDVNAVILRSAGVPLIAGSRDAFVISARRARRLKTHRHRCNPDGAYSQIQCFRECLWRRMVAAIGCRLPHMVHKDVYLPDLDGPFSALPLCSKMVRPYSDHNRLLPYLTPEKAVPKPLYC